MLIGQQARRAARLDAVSLHSAGRKALFSGSAALAALAWANPALAQDANALAAAPSADTGEIIVTALKRAESVLKVPAAISVVGGGDLKTAGVNTVTDLQNLVPGLNIGTGGFGVNISIRGITSTDQTSKGELGIAYNVDGAFVGRGQEQGLPYFDIERVEVLRGPQGTLYGRSSTGGAINVITKKPVIGAFEGYGKFEYGNYNTFRGEAAINMPVNDRIAIRLAGNFNARDGYLKPQGFSIVDTNAVPPTNSYTFAPGSQKAKNDQSDQTGRVSIVIKPSDDVTFTGIATIGHQGGVGPGLALLDSLDAGGSRQFDILANPVPAFQDTNFQNFVGMLNVRFGGAQLDLLASHQHFKDHTQVTSTNNPLANTTGAGPSPVFPGSSAFTLADYQGVFDTTQLEARISNADPGTLDYVAGANYYYEKTNESDHNWSAPVGTPLDTMTYQNGIDPLNTTTHKSYGFFAQGTYHVTPQLGVVAGARYTHDETVRVGTFAVPFFNPALGSPFSPGSAWLDPDGQPCHYPNDCVGNPNNGNQSDSKVTWRLGLNYQITPKDLLFASVSTGFKAGGFNDFDPSTGTTAPYGPEMLTAYEVGYKGKPIQGLTLTSDFYYYDYSKQQFNSLVFFGPGGTPPGVLYTAIGRSHSYGWENEFSYQVGRDTTISGNLTLSHSKVDDLSTGRVSTNQFQYAGQPLDRNPKFTATGVINHSFELGGGARIKLRGLIKYSASYLLTDLSNVVQFRQKSYTRSDASITYAAAGDRFTVQAFVENIENKLQKTAVTSNYAGAYGGTNGNFVPSAEAIPNSLAFGVNSPRFYGIRLGAKF
ncbi:TonB-dependent receptor [Novosphingobium sp.]|uniref:TonB-dependent receptor n=1 Tax=Novosphingobium sp. TaxID=1874826 RepID=UPI0038BB68FF